MNKARDVQEAQAEALVEMVKQAAPMPEHVGTQLDVVSLTGASVRVSPAWPLITRRYACHGPTSPA